jgi:hypothetical protein
VTKAQRRLDAFRIDPGSATGVLMKSVERAFHATMDVAGIADSVARAYPGTEVPTLVHANEVLREYDRLVTRWNELEERRRLELLCFFAERAARGLGTRLVADIWPEPQTLPERTARALCEGARRQLTWEQTPVTPAPADSLAGSTAFAVAAMLDYPPDVPGYLSTLDWVRVWVLLAILGAFCGLDPL